ncbi:hypothetical protein UB51_14425 [Paenibacillus sp. IHBB 10380]|nr:hypothetical protein UB51_14425 [Paenibacillus sp. IHBB 10380]
MRCGFWQYMLIVVKRTELLCRSVAFAKKLSYGKLLRKHTLAPEFLPQTAVYSRKFGATAIRKDNPSA